MGMQKADSTHEIEKERILTCVNFVIYMNYIFPTILFRIHFPQFLGLSTHEYDIQNNTRIFDWFVNFQTESFPAK